MTQRDSIFFLQELILYFFLPPTLSPSRILSVIQVDVILVEDDKEATLSSHNLTFFILWLSVVLVQGCRILRSQIFGIQIYKKAIWRVENEFYVSRIDSDSQMSDKLDLLESCRFHTALL